jgi:hypothetical protein
MSEFARVPTVNYLTRWSIPVAFIVDPQAWLADVLGRINDHPAAGLHDLLPWHWKQCEDHAAAA